ncbi:hypothetical protein [Actinoplanes sp. HUAS TT8]|uniref:hypothetical protein n=1 Tax=Actinoplanes sp. HUAS TT8 TaxID=3447453 RepID=UPI003F52016C
MSSGNLLQTASTIFVGLVGLWLVHSFRRQIRLKLAERQLDSYQKLWTIIATATPERDTPLTEDERKVVYDHMVDWYFGTGDGVFASAPTRDLYVAVRTNLVCPPAAMTPPTLARQLASLSAEEAERRRGCVVIRQASLLRAQLKNELSIHYGFHYYSVLRPEDKEFLRSCGMSPLRRPWRPRLFGNANRPRSNTCVCGLC